MLAVERRHGVLIVQIRVTAHAAHQLVRPDLAGDLDGVLDEFDRVIGLDRLRALHLNDSKNPLGSHKDRHERIGEGTLGLETFRAVVTNPRLEGLPMVLETPQVGLDGWAAEIALLRQIASEGR